MSKIVQKTCPKHDQKSCINIHKYTSKRAQKYGLQFVNPKNLTMRNLAKKLVKK